MNLLKERYTPIRLLSNLLTSNKRSEKKIKLLKFFCQIINVFIYIKVSIYILCHIFGLCNPYKSENKDGEYDKRGVTV